MHFLTEKDTEIIHKDQIGRYGGGGNTVRSPSLLQSAVAQPKHSFGKTDVYPTIYDKAAAYLFYLCSNHPFIDGNKRTALVSALTFLSLNDHCIDFDPESLELLVIKVARGNSSVKEIAQFFKKCLRSTLLT